MDFFERDLDRYIHGSWQYKRSLVHKDLKNEPIFIEANDSNELDAKKIRVKEFLTNEWTKVQLKQEYENLTYERKNLLSRVSKELQSLEWKKVHLPLKIFSTDIIKYDDRMFRPIGYFICGDNGEKYGESNGDRIYSTLEPEKETNFFFTKLWCKIFKDENKLISINQKNYKQDIKYNEDLKRYYQLKKEQDLWQKQYKETYNIRLAKYYFNNPLFIQQQVYNILVTSKYHHKQLAYNDKYFKYYSNEKKLEMIYLLPSDNILKEYFKKPNYDNLKWEEYTHEEKEKRKELIWNQLILVAIYEQFLADKFGIIQTVFLRSMAWQFNLVTGNNEWKVINEVKFTREEVSKFNFNKLNSNECMNYHVKRYKNEIENKDNLELNNRLSSIEDAISDIPYSIDIEPSVNTHIETLNNDGVVNIHK